MRRPPRWLLLVYAAVLRLYPARARRRFGDEPLVLFTALWTEERPDRALPAANWIVKMVLGAARAGAASHRDEMRHRRYRREPQRERRPLHDAVGSDLRQALRSIRRSPWHSLTTTAVVATGLALAATVFALVDGILFKPLPYRAPNELFAVRGLAGGQPDTIAGRAVSPRDVADWQAAVPDAAFTMHHTSVGIGTLGVINGPNVWTRQIDDKFWDVLGVRPLIGGFAPEDYFGAQQPIQPAVILYALWQGLFGGDVNVLGRHIDGSRGRFRVAGVMPRDFVFPAAIASARPDILLPSTQAAPRDSSRGSRHVEALVRIPSTLEVDAVRARLDDITRQGGAEFTSPNPRARAFDGVDLAPLHQAIAMNERPAAVVALAAVAAIVLLVGVNAGGLAASRAIDRRREMAARRALGASATDLTRLAVIESTLPVAAGAAVGLTAARWLLTETMLRLPANVAVFRELAIDSRVVLVTLAMATLMVFAAAVFSVRTASRSEPSLVLGRGAGAEVPHRGAGRMAFEAAQVALAVILVLGGALFVTSLARVWSADTGYNFADTLYLEVRLGRGDTAPTTRALELLERLRAIPGVARAGMIDTILLGNMRRGSVLMADTGVDSDIGELIPVSSAYFDLAELPAIEGRLPADAEIDSGALVAVVSQRVARAYWPGQSAVGRILASKRTTVTVIGVVADARFQALDRASSGEIYVPVSLALWPPNPTYLVRGRIAKPALFRALVDAVRDFDASSEVRRAQRVEEALAESIRRRRFQAWLFGLMAAAGLIVAGVGILGLTAGSTARRTREMGVRLALGSTRERLLALIVREQLTPIAAGLIAGLAVSAWGVRFARSLLYELSEYDPVVWSVAAALVLFVAIAGILLPAFRVARVDPVHALRVE